MPRFPYPKCALICVSFMAAYTLYDWGLFDGLPGLVHGYGYLSMFIGGLLFSTGFTTPFAIAVFIAMAPFVHPVLGALVAGLGAMFADVCLLRFVRFELTDELDRLKRTKPIRWMRSFLDHEGLTERGRTFLIWILTGLVVASPLPDEIAIMMVGGMTNVRSHPFMAFTYTMNTIGISLILLGTDVL